MPRRLTLVALSALILALPAAAQAMGAAHGPAAESDSPISDQGSSYHFRSQITAVQPSIPGVSLQVLEFADRLLLTNHSSRTVTVYGYQNESYARVLANGTVELNTRSPAYYLNQSFYGNVKVPASASPNAQPTWVVVDRTGQLEWHDHRIHWMSPALPPQVKDQAKRTKIFDWQVPIAIGTRKGAVHGELFWTPESGSKTPLGAIVALVAVALLGLLFVLYVRRRRSRQAPPTGTAAGGATSTEEPSPPGEAW
ncbi:MAG: hypothetical protein ACYDHN_12410 [Solirubrobacteraceae bacterium]